MIMDQHELIQFGDNHSCQIFKFNNNYSHFETACGFIFHDEESGLRVLLTVNHLFGHPFDNEHFGVFSEIGENGKGRFSITRLNSMYLGSKDSNVFEPVDIRYRLLGEQEYFMNYECDKENPESFHCIGQCMPFSSVVSPNLADKYYFCGRIKPEHVINETENGRQSIAGFQRVFEEIEFLSEEPDCTLRFSLPEYKELSSNKYQGCSGAAIFNKNGELVSMLTGQSTNRDFVGINLARILPAIVQSLMIASQHDDKKKDNDGDAHLLQIHLKC